MHESSPRAILRFLKAECGHPVSGNELASRLGISRTAVWKHIQHLKNLGYPIESTPRKGHLLVELPDLLIPEEVLPALNTLWLARHYHYFTELDSTNDAAMRLAAQGAPHGTCVLAETQTAGRGRLRRSWFSSAGKGIYLSILLTTPLPVRQAPQTTMVAALALARTLERRFALPVRIKWPNDLLIRDKKFVGILTEMQSDQDQVRFLVIGIGINVNHEPEEMDGPFRTPATSVAIEAGGPIRRQDLLVAFFTQFEQEFERFLREGFEAFLPELEGLSGTLGKTISVQYGSETLTGTALRLTADGALVLRTPQGADQTVWVGDIS